MCHNTQIDVCTGFPRGLGEGRAGRGACDIVATGGVSRQPLEAIDEAEHIRHECLGDGEGAGQPFAPANTRSMCWSRALRNASKCMRRLLSRTSGFSIMEMRRHDDRKSGDSDDDPLSVMMTMRRPFDSPGNRLRALTNPS
jgi:hypothetical protein